MLLQLCPVPSINDLLNSPISDLKIIAPLLDLQTFCDLIVAFGDDEIGRQLNYPFFDTLNITQSFEGKFETWTLFGIIQFPENVIENFELRNGLNIFTDSLWGIPSNINQIEKLPNTMFSLYCCISRSESFKEKLDYFRCFDEIHLEMGQLSNHSVSFSELLELTKHAKILRFVSSLPCPFAIASLSKIQSWLSSSFPVLTFSSPPWK